MLIFTEQKSKTLADANGWSRAYAEGFLKGKYSRRSGARLSSYGMVGLDEFCLGFRAGYFERQTPAAMRVETTAALERAAPGVRGATVAASAPATTFKHGFAS